MKASETVQNVPPPPPPCPPCIKPPPAPPLPILDLRAKTMKNKVDIPKALKPKMMPKNGTKLRQIQWTKIPTEKVHHIIDHIIHHIVHISYGIFLY